MTSSDDNATSSSSSGEHDRRRERRYGFSRRCMLSIVSPVWAITPKPLSGLTENITFTGIKVTSLKTAPGQAQAWYDAVRSDVEARVEVMLPDLDGFPSLKGLMVWVHMPVMAPGRFDDAGTSVGILFSIMKEQERRAIRDLIAAVAKEDTGF